jgi:hypothetical protein
MSKVLVIAISTICTWLLIVNFNKKTEVFNKNLTSNTRKHEIKISEYLSPMMDSTEQARYKYLFKTSLNGNLDSLKELIAFSCGGGSRCYGHGVLIFKIAEQIGEEPFIKIIPSMSMDERSWLKTLLELGLEYADFNEKHDSITLEEKFPKVSATLDYYIGNSFCFPLRRLNIRLC